MSKVYLNKDVLSLAEERIRFTFNTFGKICVSFSGGKDSTVLLHLTAHEARKRNTKISVMFIDWEAQFQVTIEHVSAMREYYSDCIENFYWVALPLSTPNGVSQFENHWICWEPDTEWVRRPPEYAITDESFFPFYHYGMTFEEFILSFNQWFCGKKPAAILVGIRSDESLNRFMSISSKSKLRYANDKPWSTASLSGSYYMLYPIYDWKINDIWVYVTTRSLPYNTLYNLMYQAKVPWGSMRICEPFGPEQRKGLSLYQILEPETWEKVCVRVKGACSGARYSNEPFFYAKSKIIKPEHHSWKTYAYFLLETMPLHTSEHYRFKINVYLRWYEKKGVSDIPDEQENDLGYNDIPSWRRICKVILRHDYWCRMLSFSPTKSTSYQKYYARMKQFIRQE